MRSSRGAAVEALELPIEEHFHDARSDALYTAKVFTAIHPLKPEIKIFNSNHIKKSKAVTPNFMWQ